MTADSTRFYDALADQFHLVYADWERSMGRQAAALDRIIRTTLGDGPKRVLDCTCGIGTQALGLAKCGHAVHGTDLSGRAIERARREARQRGLDVRFDVADVRELPRAFDGVFDVVLSADNSLAHLLTEADLARAAAAMRRTLTPGGLFLASLRDYDTILAAPPASTPPSYGGEPGARHITFQLWQWQADGRRYHFELFVMREGTEGWSVAVHEATYRATTRAELTTAIERAGLTGAEWAMPEHTGFFQQLVSARNHA